MIWNKEMEQQVMALPLEERARLADRLLSSLELPVDDQWYKDLDAEIQSRIKAGQEGLLTSVDGAAATTRIWDKLKQCS